MFRRIHRRFGWKFWAFISGGAALAGDTEDFFKRLGYAVVQGYGMTETASLISLNHPFRAAQGSIGKVLPGREFRLAEDGEILVRGENVASGYWQKGALQHSNETSKKIPAGCALAILANSTPKATCASAAAKKASSSRPPASMCIPKIWKPRCASSPACATA